MTERAPAFPLWLWQISLGISPYFHAEDSTRSCLFAQSLPKKRPTPFRLVVRSARGDRWGAYVSKSMITCADSSGKVPDFALYGRRNTARKKVSCVLSTANIIILSRTIEIFKKNLFAFLETAKEQAENWELSGESSPHFVYPSLIEMVAPLTFSS